MKSCGAGFHGQKNAERLRRKVEAELMTGTYRMNVKKVWKEFRTEYERRVLDGLAPRSRDEARTSLNHFERVVRPIRMIALCTAHVDDFIAARRKDRGLRKDEPVSPATINKDLRHVKAALRVAKEWGYLHDVPRFHMQKVPQKLPTYVNPDEFATLYAACGTWPAGRRTSPTPPRTGGGRCSCSPT